MFKEFAKRLADVVEEQGGAEVFAVRVGVPEVTVRRYLRAEKPFSLEIMERMADAGRINRLWLVFGDDYPRIPPHRPPTGRSIIAKGDSDAKGGEDIKSGSSSPQSGPQSGQSRKPEAGKSGRKNPGKDSGEGKES